MQLTFPARRVSAQYGVKLQSLTRDELFATPGDTTSSNCQEFKNGSGKEPDRYLRMMPSKGIQLYTFIAIENCQVSYTVPGFSILQEKTGTYNDHLEVDKAQIQGLFDFVGRFQFTVKVNGKAITSQYVNINTLTENMESGTMKLNVDQRSVVINELIVFYGLYDAGQSGEAGLPKSDQCYVMVTKNRLNWQGTTARQEVLRKHTMLA
ncbi:PLC-like phosphodiesterase [Venturia nashicola]|uniref:PLC-like phosphodiesterase n=1 Tax=Venturia nashicola TaxID=86259 RepID=A0A4Z1PII1_9PEZI|nr:PLC-like phosphodiesterase [Venturia nashicola]